MSDTDFAISPSSWAVRFWVWWHGWQGDQAVMRVVRLGWVH